MRSAGGLVILTVVIGSVLAGAPASASSGVAISTTINGRSAAQASQSEPIRLVPHQPATVNVVVTNDSAASITVGRVEISGRVLGLSFFDFSTSVSLAVPASSTQTLSYQLDLSGLG